MNNESLILSVQKPVFRLAIFLFKKINALKKLKSICTYLNVMLTLIFYSYSIDLVLIQAGSEAVKYIVGSVCEKSRLALLKALCHRDLGRNHVHLTVRLGFITQHLWLGDFGKCNQGLHARTLR